MATGEQVAALTVATGNIRVAAYRSNRGKGRDQHRTMRAAAFRASIKICPNVGGLCIREAPDFMIRHFTRRALGLVEKVPGRSSKCA